MQQPGERSFHSFYQVSTCSCSGNWSFAQLYQGWIFYIAPPTPSWTSVAFVGPQHITDLCTCPTPHAASKMWWAWSLQRASRWLTHQTDCLHGASHFFFCSVENSLISVKAFEMVNSEYVKLIVFYFESKLLFPFLGTQAEQYNFSFILLMEAIKQDDYLKQLWMQGRIVFFIPSKLWLLRKQSDTSFENACRV